MIFYFLGIFLFGLLIGSFINVCIYRVPLGLSVSRPRSHCTSCKTPIAWYDNIPVASYIILGRKCRRCGATISWQYPLVECLTGIAFLFVAYFYTFQMIVPFLLYFTFVLIVVSGIDIPYQIIPDSFSLSLAGVGLCASFANPLLGTGTIERVFQSCAGGVTGAVILILLGLLGTWLFKKEAMGGGDVKLLAGIGTFVGWHRVLSTLFIASLFGTIVGIYLIAAKKHEKKGYIPFGPFLALAGYINLFIPDPLVLLSLLWY